MKRLMCEMCGGTDLIKDNGVFVCQSCGCKYTIEEARKMMIEGVVEVTGTVKVDNTKQIENLMVNAERAYKDNRYQDAQSLYKQVLALDPNNVKAILHEGISAGWQGNLVRYTMQQATDSTIRALHTADKETERTYVLEKFVCEALSEITDLGKAVVRLCEKSLQEAIDRSNRELESLKSYSNRSGLYADYEWIKQRANASMKSLEADQKKYGEIKDNTYLLVLSVYEEALKMFHDAEKYEVETCDQMIYKLKGCRIDKNAYYQLTVNKYQNVLNSIQNIRKKKEDQLKEIEKERVRKYWEDHKEDKARLDSELSDLNEEKRKLYTQASKLMNSIDQYQGKKEQRIPMEDELDILEEQKKELTDQKSRLGLFKSKEKRVLDDQIQEIEKEILVLKERILEKKHEIQTECDKEIAERQKEKQVVDTQLKQVNQRIDEIQVIISTARVSDIEKFKNGEEIYVKTTSNSFMSYDEHMEQFTSGEESYTKEMLKSVLSADDLMLKCLEGEHILSEEDAEIMKNEWLQSGRITYDRFSEMSFEDIEELFIEIAEEY